MPKLDAVRVAVRDRRRVGVFLAITCVLFGVIAVRLGDLQVLQHDQWRHEAFVQSAATVVLPAQRGAILDRNGRELAASISRDAVYADPTLVQDAPYYAHSLAPLLGVSEDKLRSLLERHQITVNGKSVWSRYASLAPAVEPAVSAEIEAMRFPGVYTRPEPQREYPDGSLASALLGRTVPGNDGPVGASGIELTYNKLLAGSPGLLETERDQQGVPIPMSQRRYEPARTGRSVQLSIDEGVQYQAESVLLDEVAAQQAHAGMATIVDLRTGDVIAMANVVGAHGATPAHVATASDANRAVTFTYSPGSVMKIVPIATGIDTGACAANRPFPNVPDQINNGQFTIKDDEPHAAETMTPDDILVQSSNVGTTMFTRQCIGSPAALDSALRRFGFGTKTGINVPHEEHGLLVPPDQYYDSGLAANAIGYSLTATQLQVLDAYAAIARGGVPVQPRVVSATIDAAGHRANVAVHTGKRIVSAQTAATMRGFFTDVVSRGTGVCASIPNYAVGGKTGTAQKLIGGTHTNAAHVATFVGFGGNTTPVLAAIVSIDEPRDIYGARTAAPVFSEIMQYALAQLRVPPLAPTSGWTQYAEAQRHIPAGTNCSVPHGAALAAELAAQNQRAAAAAAAAYAATSSTTAGTTTTTASTGTTVAGHTKHTTTATASSTTPTTRARSTTTSTVRSTPTTATARPPTTLPRPGTGQP